jgi:hypothetical protein
MKLQICIIAHLCLAAVVISLKCCINDQCDKTCTAPPEGACRRTIYEAGNSEYQDYGPDGCAATQRISYYDQNYTSGYGWLNTNFNEGLQCNGSDLCNKAPLDIEICKWPPIPLDLLDLECSCDPVGMNNTDLGYKLGQLGINYARFCVKNVCKFRDIFKASVQEGLRGKIVWSRSACVYSYEDGSHVESVAFGCSAPLREPNEAQSNRTADEEPLSHFRDVDYVNNKDEQQLRVWCQHSKSPDGKHCNDKSYYKRLETIIKCPVQSIPEPSPHLGTLPQA